MIGLGDPLLPWPQGVGKHKTKGGKRRVAQTYHGKGNYRVNYGRRSACTIETCPLVRVPQSKASDENSTGLPDTKNGGGGGEKKNAEWDIKTGCNGAVLPNGRIKHSGEVGKILLYKYNGGGSINKNHLTKCAV